MAFLGVPRLGLNTPSRPDPLSPGTVPIDIIIPVFIDLLEKCFIENCRGARRARVFDLTAEVWGADVGQDERLFDVLFHHPGESPTLPPSHSLRPIFGEEVANAPQASASDPTLFVVEISERMIVDESQLNEDRGPVGMKPSSATRDELFVRAYLGSFFSFWQRIHTRDSNVEHGQFFGP